MFLQNKQYCEEGHCFKCCPGNICVKDPENHLRNWYPGEPLCTYTPRPKWIRKQFKINKLFLAGKISDDKYFTLNDLISIYAVRSGIEGKHNPNNAPPKHVKLALKVPYPVRSRTASTPKSYLPPPQARKDKNGSIA